MTDKSGDNGMSLRLDAKTIAQVFAFLLGGGIAGLGGSYANAPTEEMTGVAANLLTLTGQVTALAEEVNDSGKRVETAARDIADVKAEVKADRRDILRLENEAKNVRIELRGEIEAMRKRIRWLERRHGGTRDDR